MHDQPTYTCVIIDDEPIAIEVIAEHLKNFGRFRIGGTFTRPLEAVELLTRETPDLLFLDINMPGISGVEFMRSLHQKPSVIFTTAYRNFAADAFELDAVDYLVKPIAFSRFLKAINKFLALQHSTPEALAAGPLPAKILVKSENKHYNLPVDEILYIESLDNYIKIHTDSGMLISYQSLTSIENELGPSGFLRIHRSYVVNLHRITSFSTSGIWIGDTMLGIGRSYREQVLKRLKGEDQE